MNKRKDTGKFWSFKDTKNYKDTKKLSDNDNVIRTFIFEKSFLLKVSIKDVFTNEKTNCYVVPLKYTSNKFPSGYYTGTGPNKNLITFSDLNILKVIE